MNAAQILLIAKAPVPGRVKTRLCPPCTPAQAARIAAAALADTLETATGCTATARTLVLDGDHPAPPGWATLPQRGGLLGDRLANAFADARPAGTAVLLIGMDTPQLTASTHLDPALSRLTGSDAVLGPAEDGGWWALGLRDPGHAEVLRRIATSTATTGWETLTALRRRGLRVHLLPRLRDVDTAADARTVAALCPPDSRFARAVATDVPAIRDAAVSEAPALPDAAATDGPALPDAAATDGPAPLDPAADDVPPPPDPPTRAEPAGGRTTAGTGLAAGTVSTVVGR